MTKAQEDLRAQECKGCGRIFYLERTRANASRLYCDECLAAPERQRDRLYERNRRAREAYRENNTRIMPGQWALSYDPWQTGQLPKSVRENALWP